MQMNESQTRAKHIDPALIEAGWSRVEGSRIVKEYRITDGRLEGQGGRRGRTLAADYVLIYRNTKLAVIEAKAWDKPLTEGVAQAKDYAGRIKVRFAYATNGQGFYEIDMQQAAEGKISRFPSPEVLWSRTFAEPNVWRDRFAAIPFEDRGGYFQSRYYQDLAVGNVLAGLAEGRDRMLLTMATGTGKTFVAFQIAWELFQSRWNLNDWKGGTKPSRQPRILFLADRNILASQAFNAFSAFPDAALVRITPADIRKKGRVPKNAHLFFTIFQTFMTGQKDGAPSPYFGDYPPDFFDFIVIDECHRGGANDESTWRGILEHFAPAVQLGLTATPKRQDNIDTYAYFGAPVYIYSLKEGINDGYLTPFKVRQYSTTLDEYIYTPDDTVLEGEVDQGRTYTEEEFNRVIEIREREAHRVELFMSRIDQREKTLVFCATQAHALAVRDLINQTSTIPDANYCHRVTADDGKLGEQWLRDFQDNEKTIPTVLTTSQKLSTGVDARNVRNIVLMRPVRSMIEFKQIIGRGTRLFEGKDYFTIHDFVGAHALFSDPEWDGEPQGGTPCEDCGEWPCRCEKQPVTPCDACGEAPCICPPELCEACGEIPCICRRREKLKIQLADGKERQIQHMTATSFWHPDGTPMSAQEFMESLFGELPDFFEDEDELRRIWSDPATRQSLLDGLSEKGFGHEQLTEMQRILDAEGSDLFDVLAYVAYALPTLSREDRAKLAKSEIASHYNARQKAFLDFVLAHYVEVGVQELATSKLTPLLYLRYHDSLADAQRDLGEARDIGAMFSGFQKYLYLPSVHSAQSDHLPRHAESHRPGARQAKGGH